MTTPPQPLAWLDELNTEQRRAVLQDQGHTLVVAGAGSGKTRTLAYRVAYLIATGTAPERILLLTFTRRAAEEMLKRATAVTAQGHTVAAQVWGGTFHAIANRLLRFYARTAGLTPDFTVMDQSDAEDLLDLTRRELNLHERDKRFPRKRTALAIYSRCVNGAEDLEPVLKRHFPWCEEWRDALNQLFKAYVERKQQRNVLDYDDLLLFWAELLRDEAVAPHIAGRFDHILVDEYQDTNSLQAAILQGMARTGARIMAVGDDAQSIYSFRAANHRNMLDFPQQFPGTTLLTLEENYRSVASILNTTNRIIAQARERFAKTLWTQRHEGQKPLLVTCRDEAGQDRYVADEVLRHYEAGIPLRRQAVLFRAAHHADSLEIELTRRKIPYHKYGGLRFLEAAHVKDLMAFLRIVENPRDDMAWFRLLQLLPGIGPGTATRAMAHVAANAFDPAALATFNAPTAARELTATLGALLGSLRQSPAATPAADVERIRRFYDPILERVHENPKARRRDLENLEQIASGYTSRQRFLSDLQLDPPTSTSDIAGPPMLDEDWLVLSTIHSAKGCEWDVVYLIHAADGCLPSDMATNTQEEIEEELRLTYVAMTRAKDFLYVVWPLRYYHAWSRMTDRHSYAQLCRFFSEEVRSTMDARRPPGTDGQEEEPHAPTPTPGDSAATRIRSRWK